LAGRIRSQRSVVARVRCGPACGGENPSGVFGPGRQMFDEMLQRSGGRVKLADSEVLRRPSNTFHSEVREVLPVR
jgi:hypothetical protein